MTSSHFRSHLAENEARICLGQRLKQIRASRTQQEMADHLGIGKRTYAGYERDEAEIGAAPLAILVRDGWNANWLLTGEGPERLEALEPAFQSQSQSVSGEDLNIAMQLADRKIDAARKAPTRAQYAAFVAEIYNAITQGLPDADRFDFATGRRTHQGTGDDDASGQGVGE
ncbi:MAG: helix-turn-helix transcriptional regulator [Pigmentiphaga sp.]